MDKISTIYSIKGIVVPYKIRPCKYHNMAAVLSISVFPTQKNKKMPVSEIRTLTDLQLVLSPNNVNPLGKIVIYIYEEGAPSHHELRQTFDLISRECPYSKFHTMNMEILNSVSREDPNDVEFVENLKLFSYPVFLVRGQEVTRTYETETKMGLINVMKKAGVLKEDAQIFL
jgi:hypothetical protein